MEERPSDGSLDSASISLKRLVVEVQVYIVARRGEKMQDLQQRGAIAIKMDITKEEDIQRVVEQVEHNHKGIDILVNNAGYAIIVRKLLSDRLFAQIIASSY